MAERHEWYDSEGRVVDLQSWDYESEAGNGDVLFENANDITTVKTFCWDILGADTHVMVPIALTQVFNVSDYIK